MSSWMVTCSAGLAVHLSPHSCPPTRRTPSGARPCLSSRAKVGTPRIWRRAAFCTSPGCSCRPSLPTLRPRRHGSEVRDEKVKKHAHPRRPRAIGQVDQIDGALGHRLELPQQWHEGPLPQVAPTMWSGSRPTPRPQRVAARTASKYPSRMKPALSARTSARCAGTSRPLWARASGRTRSLPFYVLDPTRRAVPREICGRSEQDESADGELSRPGSALGATNGYRGRNPRRPSPPCDCCRTA